MKLLINLLCFFTLLGCSAESVSEQKIETVKVKEESNMFGLFGSKEEKTYVIASPLEGRLIKNGDPLVNVKIIRKVYWNGNEEGVVDEFTADENGFFKIPVLEKILTLNSMVEFVAKVELFVEKESDDNFFWYSVKRSEEIYSDYDGPLVNLVCDLDEPELTVEMKEFPAMTRCRWDGMSAS